MAPLLITSPVLAVSTISNPSEMNSSLKGTALAEIRTKCYSGVKKWHQYISKMFQSLQQTVDPVVPEAITTPPTPPAWQTPLITAEFFDIAPGICKQSYPWIPFIPLMP